jgi:plastocyanin
MHPPRRTAAVFTVGLGVVALSACASSGAHNNAPEPKNTSAATATMVNGVQQITISAGDDLRFTPAVITVHPGQVELIVKNTGQGAPHNLQFPGLPTTSWVPLTTAGQSNSVTFTAPAAGTYRFVCSIHERQGQTGQLIVLPN